MSTTVDIFYISLGAVGGTALVISLVISTAVFWDSSLVKYARRRAKKEARIRDGRSPGGMHNPVFEDHMHLPTGQTPNATVSHQPGQTANVTTPTSPVPATSMATGMSTTMPAGTVGPQYGASSPYQPALKSNHPNTLPKENNPYSTEVPNIVQAPQPAPRLLMASSNEDMSAQPGYSQILQTEPEQPQTLRRNLPLPVDPIYESIKVAEIMEEQRVHEERKKETERLAKLAKVESQPPYNETYLDNNDAASAEPSTSTGIKGTKTPVTKLSSSSIEQQLGDVPGYEETNFTKPSVEVRSNTALVAPHIQPGTAHPVFDSSDEEYVGESFQPSTSLTTDIANELQKKVESLQRNNREGSYVPMKNPDIEGSATDTLPYDKPKSPTEYVLTYETPKPHTVLSYEEPKPNCVRNDTGYIQIDGPEKGDIQTVEPDIGATALVKKKEKPVVEDKDYSYALEAVDGSNEIEIVEAGKKTTEATTNDEEDGINATAPMDAVLEKQKKSVLSDYSYALPLKDNRPVDGKEISGVADGYERLADQVTGSDNDLIGNTMNKQNEDVDSALLDYSYALSAEAEEMIVEDDDDVLTEDYLTENEGQSTEEAKDVADRKEENVPKNHLESDNDSKHDEIDRDNVKEEDEKISVDSDLTDTDIERNTNYIYAAAPNGNLKISGEETSSVVKEPATKMDLTDTQTEKGKDDDTIQL